jgi:hypothetical protein
VRDRYWQPVQWCESSESYPPAIPLPGRLQRLPGSFPRIVRRAARLHSRQPVQVFCLALVGAAQKAQVFGGAFGVVGVGQAPFEELLKVVNCLVETLLDIGECPLDFYIVFQDMIHPGIGGLHRGEHNGEPDVFQLVVQVFGKARVSDEAGPVVRVWVFIRQRPAEVIERASRVIAAEEARVNRASSGQRELRGEYVRDGRKCGGSGPGSRRG